MNCWEILGIHPTSDRTLIDQAFEQQKKFATGDELLRLQQAYEEASGGQPATDGTFSSLEPISEQDSGEGVKTAPGERLSAQDEQIVREVVIQVRALLNDSRRASDEGIWKAILTEPPADQPRLRAALASELEPQIRPMAANKQFPLNVVAFIGDWFGWQELQNTDLETPAHEMPDQGELQQPQGTEESQPPTANFWPAVVGWIVALAVLSAFFEGIFGP